MFVVSVCTVCVQVFAIPTDGDWFEHLLEDVHRLVDTHNFVSIFNGQKRECKKRGMMLFGDATAAHKKYQNTRKKKARDVAVLQRVETFLKPWFTAVKRKLAELKLLPSHHPVVLLLVLVSHRPLVACRTQKIH